MIFATQKEGHGRTVVSEKYMIYLHKLLRCSLAFYVIHVLLYVMLPSGDVYCFLFHGFCLEFAWICHILKPITTIALEERIFQVNVGFVWVRPPLFKHHISLWPLPALLPKDTGTWGKSSFWRWQQGPPFSKFQNTSNLKTYILVNTCHKLTANQTAHGFPVLVFFRPPRLSLSVGQKASMDHTAGQMQCFKVATNRNSVCVSGLCTLIFENMLEPVLLENFLLPLDFHHHQFKHPAMLSCIGHVPSAQASCWLSPASRFPLWCPRMQG